MNVYNVTLYFEEPGIGPATIPAAEGESILEVVEENGYHLSSNCGGVCACTTCHVYIEQGMDNLSEMSDKEEDFVDRAINPRIESRLGCQCRIHGDITVMIPDQRRIIGHEH